MTNIARARTNMKNVLRSRRSGFSGFEHKPDTGPYQQCFIEQREVAERLQKSNSASDYHRCLPLLAVPSPKKLTETWSAVSSPMDSCSTGMLEALKLEYRSYSQNSDRVLSEH